MSIATLLVACQGSPPAKEFDAKDVVAAGNLGVEYGQHMQKLGARMVEHGQASGDQAWIDDGQHWVIDGKRMGEIGESTLKLGQSMRGNPIKAQDVDINKIRVQGLGLISDGKAFVEHSKIMVELTALLKRRAEDSSAQSLSQDIADSEEQAKRMSQTGEQLVKSGEALVNFADSLSKSIGR